MRGFWEDTWLSRHADVGRPHAVSDRYVRTRALETHCMTAADLVVTLGEAMRDGDHRARRPRGQRRHRAQRGQRRLPPPAARRRGSCGPASASRPDEHVVGLVSTLVAHEGIGTLLDAVKLLNDRGVRARALIVGDGPERTALQRQAAALGLDAIFTGRVPIVRVRDYHAVLDVFVVPRTPDRVCQLVTPLKPVEAMASGLPVVVSAVQRARRDQSQTRRDRPAVAAARRRRARGPLQQLLASPDLRRQARRAAPREWVARDRTWAHNAVRYREAYQRLGRDVAALHRSATGGGQSRPGYHGGSSHEEVG